MVRDTGGGSAGGGNGRRKEGSAQAGDLPEVVTHDPVPSAVVGSGGDGAAPATRRVPPPGVKRPQRGAVRGVVGADGPRGEALRHGARRRAALRDGPGGGARLGAGGRGPGVARARERRRGEVAAEARVERRQGVVRRVAAVGVGGGRGSVSPQQWQAVQRREWQEIAHTQEQRQRVWGRMWGPFAHKMVRFWSELMTAGKVPER